MRSPASRAVVVSLRLLLLVVIPLLSFLRRRTQVGARAEDPDEEQNTKDGTNDDTGNCTTAQCLGIVAIVAVTGDGDGLCVLPSH
jgi:hypothetical protein